MLFTFLLVVQAIVAAALVGVILMQRSEGGGLGQGGSPSGLISARGAANFLTRATSILATVFVVLSITLATIASVQHRRSDLDTPVAAGGAAQPAVPAPADPLGEAARQGSGFGAMPMGAPRPDVSSGQVPAATPETPSDRAGTGNAATPDEPLN
ncbi:preprotein translocase subunit SecG [Sphingomonas jejuensis]|jgi:preprotein translocase subunit SecG|uniref:Protein-export membrane protein SecG n=1 Tax=Sphingomonas jejuensis TaxID=904715 RepID=A0ABX0XKW5_9SPHN|nr:preprotein translocase subunit SecG [Sphingomonas jejuensis]